MLDKKWRMTSIITDAFEGTNCLTRLLNVLEVKPGEVLVCRSETDPPGEGREDRMSLLIYTDRKLEDVYRE